MRSLVTGGAGFIGSNLVDKLVELGHEVTVLDNLSTGQILNLKKVKNRIKFFKVDISKNKVNLKKYFNNIDWVFHLAGIADNIPSIKNPELYFQTNVKGTLNILEVCKKNKIKKLIYAASASCYGVPKYYPTKENSEINPIFPYALTKYLGENLVIHWGKIYSMPNISLRFFNAYGPRANTKGSYGSVFSIFLAQRLAKKPLTIVGDGKQTRDFIHVFDLVNAIIQAAKKGKNCEIYNIGSGREVSINLIAKIIGGRKINVSKRPGETKRSLADISKFRSITKWKPKISIQKGVKMMLNIINQWSKAKVWTSKNLNSQTKKFQIILKGKK